MHWGIKKIAVVPGKFRFYIYFSPVFKISFTNLYVISPGARDGLLISLLIISHEKDLTCTVAARRSRQMWSAPVALGSRECARLQCRFKIRFICIK